MGIKIENFWKWSYSDLLANTTRGVLAEYIVAKALGIELTARKEWDLADLVLPAGRIIEVKSSAYLQSWPQKELSKPQFSINKHKGWDAETNTYYVEVKRWADLYVFALLAEKDKSKVDPLDVSQWKYFVLTKAFLDEEFGEQKTLSLKRLRECAESLSFEELGSALIRD